MWIQIRTIDGKETRTIEDLSRLTKIEYLRLKIQEIFNVSPENQRLFYRGKQMEDGQTLFDYNVGLNDIVQLLIRSQADPPDGPIPKDCEGMASIIQPPLTTTNTISTSASSSSSSSTTSATSAVNNNGSKTSCPPPDNQPSTSTRSYLMDPGLGSYKINELVDCRDISIGAWFEATIVRVTRSSKGQNGKSPALGQSGKPNKRTNGKLDVDQSNSGPENNGNSVYNSDSAPSTSHTDCMDIEEVTYHIKYDE